MAEQLADRYSVAHFSDDLDQLLEASRPDVVHVTTPPQSHFALARACLLASCDVYVEKPFTVNSDEARRLIDLANTQRRKITVGHNAQFQWENLQARDLVRSGFLGGPPVYIESYYTYSLGDARYAKAVLGDKQHWVRSLPGQLLHNIISHGIARIAEFVQSDSPRVWAHGYSSPLLKSIGEADVMDELRVHVVDDVNLTATFVFSSQLSPPVNGYRLYGTSNSLDIDNVHHTITRHRRRPYKSYVNYVLPPLETGLDYLASAARNIGRFARFRFHDDAGLKNLIDAFYRSILDGTPAPIPNAEILRTSIIMDAIFSQLQQHLHRGQELGAHACPGSRTY